MNEFQRMAEKLGISQPVFFKPNTEFAKWLVDYAGDRMIIDAGCGQKFLLSQQLIQNGADKIVAIDPQVDYMGEYQKWRMLNDNRVDISFHVLPGTMEKYKTFLQMDKEILLIFARPCHSNWVEETLDWKNDKVEALYITLPENLEEYDDLGKWGKKAKLIKHKGSSADEEVVYSIK